MGVGRRELWFRCGGADLGLRARSSSACASTGWRAKRTIIGTVICRPRKRGEHDLRLANERFEAIIAERTAALRVGETNVPRSSAISRPWPTAAADDARLHQWNSSVMPSSTLGLSAADFIDMRSALRQPHPPEDVDDVARIVADGDQEQAIL